LADKKPINLKKQIQQKIKAIEDNEEIEEWKDKS